MQVRVLVERISKDPPRWSWSVVDMAGNTLMSGEANSEALAWNAAEQWILEHIPNAVVIEGLDEPNPPAL